MRKYDVLIIGAGAAGMMCGLIAGRKKRQVILLDHASRLGQKIRISGGGRCNFTNINTSPNNFVSQNPHFCKSALARFSPLDFLTLIKKHGIEYHEKKLGQLFCTGSAQQITDMLEQECLAVKNQFVLNCSVHSITQNGHFLVKTNQGDFHTQALVIATGGLSIPKIGATGFGYSVAKQFGLGLIETAPALDGFCLSQSDLANLASLTGIALDAIVQINGASFRENILFTHKGLSGPASLQASLYWRQGNSLSIDLLPEQKAHLLLDELRKISPKLSIKNSLAEFLPHRLAERFCELNNYPMRITDLSENNFQRLCQKLHAWQLSPVSTVGYQKAEVTRGGIDTKELSSQTMEAKKAPGLFFIGEVVDVTGQLGGYNFQWAWSSGFACGEAL